MTLTRLARRKSFSCLHRYAVNEWSDEQNQNVFGACFTPNGHGHNYELEAYFEGPVHPQTGMILNLADVDRILQELVEPLEGKRLDRDVAPLHGKVPTTEVLALHLFSELKSKATAHGIQLCKLRLYEYEDLWVDVWP